MKRYTHNFDDKNLDTGVKTEVSRFRQIINVYTILAHDVALFNALH